MLKTQLNKARIRLPLAISTFLVASTAAAHPGEHMEFTMPQVINHMITSPFHAGIIITALVAVVVAVSLVSKRKGSKANKSE